LNRSSELFQSFPVRKSEVYLYGSHTAEVATGWACRRHLHHMMIELNLVLEGEQLLLMDGEETRMRAGDIALVPPMLLHAFRADKPLRYFVVHIQVDDPAFLQLLTDAQQVLLTADRELNRLIVPEVRRLMELLAGGASKIRLFHSLYGIMDHIEHYYVHNSEHADRAAANLLPVRIAQEIETIVTAPSAEREEGALSVNWLEEIADKLGFSRRHCHRVFQETYRMSPRQYLAVLRQQEAMQLLLHDAGSVEQIALRIGYDNAQSFIRQFVKWTGMTPGAFRKQKGGDITYLTPLELESSRDR